MLNDRTMIDFIKENMMKEQIRNEEMFTILQEQVDYGRPLTAALRTVPTARKPL